jgi:hypothetical protein
MLLVAGLILVAVATFEVRGFAGPAAAQALTPPAGPFDAAPFAIVEPPAAQTRPMAAAAEAPPTAGALSTVAAPAPPPARTNDAAAPIGAPADGARPTHAPPPAIRYPLLGERWTRPDIIRCLAELRDYLTRPSRDRGDIRCRAV